MKNVYRSVDFTPVSSETNDGHTLEGYGAVFNAPTRINSWEGDFTERIAPGAFRKTLDDDGTPIMQFDHGHDARVGSVPIGEIQDIREDPSGLYVKARLFDNPVVEPVRQAIAGKAIRGMSFAFQVVRDEWHDRTGKQISPEELQRLLYDAGDRGPLQRTLHEVRMSEVGPVVRPAYKQTSVGVRSEERDAYRDELVAQYESNYERDGGIETPPGPPSPPTPMPMPGDKGFVPEAEHRCKGLAVGEADCPTPAVHSGGIRRGGNEPGNGKDPYGDVEYADPGYQKDGQKRYPLDSEKHALAAWDYINHPDDADEYTPDQLVSMKAKIKAACKKYGIATDEAKSSEAQELARQIGEMKTLADDTKQRKAAVMPKSIAEMLARLDEIGERMTELGSDETRSLDETEEQEFDGLVAERAELKAAVKKVEDRMALLREEAAERGSRKVEAGAKFPTPNVRVTPDDIHSADEVRKSAYNEQDYVRRCEDMAKRNIEAVDMRGFKEEARQRATAEELLANVIEKGYEKGELARRIMATGDPVYERAFSKMALSMGQGFVLSPEEYRALERAQSVTTATAGGYAIPFQLDPTVMLDNASTNNPMRQLARHIQITGKQWDGVTSPGVSVQRGSEAATAPDSSFTLGQPTITTNRVSAFVPFSYEVDLEWSSLRSVISTLIQDGKDIEEDSFITGDGSGTDPGGIVGTLASGQDFATSGAGAVVVADIYNFELNLPVRWRRNGQFLANKAFYNKVRQFDSAGGSQLWQRIGGGTPNELLSYPVHEASAMSSELTTSGQIVAVFGDFQYFAIVDRIGMNMELVPQLFDASNSNRPTGQRGIYAIWMNNSAILLQHAFTGLKVQ